MTNSSYQVIARRWRPTQFSELVGQDHVVRTLGNAIEMNRIAHAYLFVGPRGTGKTTSARLFAKSLNWEDGPSLEVPENSEIGKTIMQGRCLDVIEIDGASNNSVDQVRDLRDECQYAPAQCRFKIYVIDEVHMLSQAAFNALLKTLEEPPPHVKFVFATTESNKVLPTIVSRCQRFEFRSIPVDLIVSKLSQICEKEKIVVDKEALNAIARMAQGGMRDAQSILDQMISFCGKTITQENVLDVYGLVSRDRIVRLGQNIFEGNFEEILEESNSFATEGVDFYRALLDLADYTREYLTDCLKGESKSYPEQAVRVLDALKQGEDLVRSGLSEKTNFEVTLLRSVEAGKSKSIDKVIREISVLLSDQSKKKTSNRNNDLNIETVLPPPSIEEVKPPKKQSDSIQKNKTLDPQTIDSAEILENIHSSSVTELVNSKTNEVEGNKDIPTSQVNSPNNIKDVNRDPIIVAERVGKLPSVIKDFMAAKVRADFVSIEKIDPNSLI